MISFQLFAISFQLQSAFLLDHSPVILILHNDYWETDAPGIAYEHAFLKAKHHFQHEPILYIFVTHTVPSEFLQLPYVFYHILA